MADKIIAQTPFMYVFSDRFTNRKWRERDCSVVLSSDADFELQAVAIFSPVPTLIRIDEIMERFEELPIGENFPILPAMTWRAGRFIRASIKLKDGVSIGRIRPLFEVSYLGLKIFTMPAPPLYQRLPA